jgi:hypothetical protein
LIVEWRTYRDGSRQDRERRQENIERGEQTGQREDRIT